jgi:hypothetical protein
MNYRALKNYPIKLSAKETKDLDAGTGLVLVPQGSAKVFLHWVTESGKVYATHTLSYPTLVQNTLKLVNGPEETQILVIELG